MQDVGGVGGIGTRPSDGDKYTHHGGRQVYSLNTGWEEVYSVKYKHTMGGSADKKDWDNSGWRRNGGEKDLIKRGKVFKK